MPDIARKRIFPVTDDDLSINMHCIAKNVSDNDSGGFLLAWNESLEKYTGVNKKYTGVNKRKEGTQSQTRASCSLFSHPYLHLLA